MTQPVRPTRDSWPTLPMPEERAALDIQRQFTAEEYDRLLRGSIPDSMDDRWFIFMEDDVLYFHRSWSGHCAYQLELEASDGGYVVKEAWVNRDAEQYASAGDEFDAVVVTSLIDNLLRK